MLDAFDERKMWIYYLHLWVKITKLEKADIIIYFEDEDLLTVARKKEQERDMFGLDREAGRQLPPEPKL
ncbi:hypothetical protein NQ317_006920 [Molorchus minor]|uniref:Uncharacterized protein n=1 Tax=Molorchus minor TaxID=1323400 RepID=A0ABQ9J7D4_9CUCU|nr:hypothetical protein NQ317_006920 [Molorchus minor]